METDIGQIGVQSIVFADEFLLAWLFHRLRKNGVAIVVIKDHDILAAPTGGRRKTASLIGCNFSS